MAQHILRKDLKKDEIRESLVHGVESVASHQQMLWVVVTAALVVALGVFGWSSYTRRQTARASASLDDAIRAVKLIASKTADALRRFCPSRPTSGMMRWRL